MSTSGDKMHRYHRRPSYAPAPSSPPLQSNWAMAYSSRQKRQAVHSGYRYLCNRFTLYILLVLVAIFTLHHLTSTTHPSSLPRSPTFHLPPGIHLYPPPLSSHRPKAALISLVRNTELPGIQQSIRQLEHQFNANASHRYPWVFFNDEPFDDEFISGTVGLTSAGAYYEVIPSNHWEIPRWVSKGRFLSSLEYLGSIGVGKGWLVSYRHMCRWNSGFFFRHPRLLDFDYYWRVEPEVHFMCKIPYDPFLFMKQNNLKYGFNMNILDDARSFPSMWRITQDFLEKNPDILRPDAKLEWILSEESTYLGHDEGTPMWQEREYNGCQFFSNFEIGDLNFFRSEKYLRYFDYLDLKGGFFYERWGDAPLHTLAVAMLLPQNETHWFQDIGYQHDVNSICPDDARRCSCEPTDLDSGFYTLVPLESVQVKPMESCIRMWLRAKYSDGTMPYGL